MFRGNIVLVMLFAIMFGCGKNEIIHFSSLDNAQSITVINKGELRYVINGLHEDIPDSNYVKLNISNIDPIGDGFHICWKDSDYEWSVVVHNSEVIDSTLDTTRFSFNVSLPLDDRRIPTELKFRQENCAIYSFSLERLSPDQGAIVEIK